MSRIQDVGLAIVVIGVVMMLIIPLPPELLDLLLALNIAGSVITILVSIYIHNPLEFTVFPTVLLMATLFRLALDVSATRMILLNGSLRDSAGELVGAGTVIPAFGQVVVGGNIVVGLVMFLILIIIQFMVITSGAERIAQVAARFTLDAMPGKYMAIDSDLHSGCITAEEARRLRKDVDRASDFYGAMDGAGKFVKGDAMAAVVIMIVNLLGGMLVGLLYQSLGVGDAFRTYAILSIGNGLVTTLPAFLMSTSMGMVVTRAASDANLADEVIRQVTAQPVAVRVASGFMAALSLLGVLGLFALPWLPFAALSALFAVIARGLERQRVQVLAAATEKVEVQKRDDTKRVEVAATMLPVDPVALEVGRGLLPLVDPAQGQRLLERVTSIRRHVALEIGIIVPGVRFRDNLQLKPSSYVIKIRDLEVAQGEVMMNQYLAIGPDERLKALRGTRVTDPTYGLPAVWIPAEQRGEAERTGCMIFDPVSVMATQLTEIIRAHAATLLGRQEVQGLLDVVRKTHPAVVKDLVPDPLSLGDVQNILQRLLSERVSVRDLVMILEATADHVRVTQDVEALTECVRVRLSPAICSRYTGQDGVMNVITVDPQVEQVVAGSVQRSEVGTYLALDPSIGHAILQAVGKEVRTLEDRGLQPILLVAPQVRAALRRLTERTFPSLVVLSWNEIAPRIHVQPVAMISA